MNDLDLPSRKALPPEVRDRIRGVTDSGAAESPSRHRYRGPLAVAAGVAVLAAGAVMVTQSTGRDSVGVGSTPTSSSQSSQSPPDVYVAPPPTVVSADDPVVTAALDRCGAAVEASPRAFEFPPRSAWQPVYGVEMNGQFVVPYREYGGKPGVCATTATTATVSDPSHEPMDLGQPDDRAGQPSYTYSGLLYLPETGVLAGFAQGVETMAVTVDDPSGVRIRIPAQTLADELFVVGVGTLADGERIHSVVSYPGGSDEFELVFDSAKVRPVGATLTDR
jgi:hypothetical protein